MFAEETNEGVLKHPALVTTPILFSDVSANATAKIPPPLAGQVFRIHISEMRTAQGGVADDIVDKKVKKMQTRLNKIGIEGVENILRTKPVPLVRLPDGQLLMLDKHHMTRAAFKAGLSETFAYVAFDLTGDPSLKDPEKLNQYLKRQGWVWLRDAQGNVLSSITELPIHIADVQHDPYRSLGKAIVKSNRVHKSTVAFAEFHWGEYFRSRIPLADLVDAQGNLKAEAVERAGVMARGIDARHLPGYAGKWRYLPTATGAVQKAGVFGMALAMVGIGADSTVREAVSQNKCVPAILRFSDAFIQEIRHLDFERARLIAEDCTRNHVSIDFEKERKNIMDQSKVGPVSIRCFENDRMTLVHKNGMTSTVQFRSNGAVESLNTHPSLNNGSRQYDLDYRKQQNRDWKVAMRLRENNRDVDSIENTVAGLSARLLCSQNKGCKSNELQTQVGQFDELTTGLQPFGFLTNREMQPAAESFFNARALVLYSVMQSNSFVGVCQLVGATMDENLHSQERTANSTSLSTTSSVPSLNMVHSGAR